MAFTQTYCDFATGNDYKGATFTDGAFANATLTLTKAGAFAATKVNHWLYLDDNGSGEVATGYYRVTDVGGIPNAVVLHADIRSGANDPTDVVCTQADGTTTLPWRSAQGACDLITRDSTNGDQINVIAGTSQTLSASLSLTTYGTPTAAAPLVIRGCTATADDGGQGVLDGNAGDFTIIAGRPVDLVLRDLRLRNTAGANVLELGARNQVYNCEVDTTAANVSLVGISTNANCIVAHCYIHDVGRGIQTGYGAGQYRNNYIVPLSLSGAHGILNNGTSTDTFEGNVVKCSHAGAYGYAANNTNVAQVLAGNVFYNTAAGTTVGVLLNDNAAGTGQTSINNIIVGWSGAGGVGIRHDGRPGVVGHNAFYGNSTNETYALDPLVDLAGDVILAADPFVDAANGDFSLTAAAKTALASKGWPLAYLGAHANTVPNLNIGPIQMAASSGSSGAVRILPLRGSIG